MPYRRVVFGIARDMGHEMLLFRVTSMLMDIAPLLFKNAGVS